MFKKGDKVTWSSQSRGRRTEKTGDIISVVKSGDYPRGYCPNGGPPGMPRNHESYIVQVKSRTYWPIVKQLRLA